ncbi:MAG: TIGR02449 family protein [Gammaproteobacteria bacterium RBG_16_57_12]|nr:MAG: TIGR02449 family protein [Gammaproteobacteria bacterium RBG_16_57_12]
MADPDVKKLEYLIDELIKVCEDLKRENDLLRDRQSSLATERTRLIEMNEQARSRVEAMIMRLKSLERDV